MNEEMLKILEDETVSIELRQMAMEIIACETGTKAPTLEFSLSEVEFPLTIVRLLLATSLCPSGASARRLIMAGQVHISGVDDIIIDTVFNSPEDLLGTWLNVGKSPSIRLIK